MNDQCAFVVSVWYNTFFANSPKVSGRAPDPFGFGTKSNGPWSLPLAVRSEPRSPGGPIAALRLIRQSMSQVTAQCRLGLIISGNRVYCVTVVQRACHRGHAYDLNHMP